MFRIDTQLVNSSTLLFSSSLVKPALKSESKDLHTGPRLQVQYGRKFERNTTIHARGCGNLPSKWHNRIVSYVSTVMLGFLNITEYACEGFWRIETAASV